MTASQPTTRGAALVMALVILMALMLLGLPFLFSQSVGMSGTRSFAHRQLTAAGLSTAEATGIGAAAVAVAPHFKANQNEAFSSIGLTLKDVLKVDVVQGPDGNNRTALDLDSGALAQLGLCAPGRTDQPTVGITIEDEAGKLDVNCLTVAGWHHLLRAVGIGDWDDDDVLDDEDGSHIWPLHRTETPESFSDDADHYGELARKLAELRLFLPGSRITRLEQLLLAGNTRALSQGRYSRSFRNHLTVTELERLRPFLTLHNPGQGREGQTDLGTVMGSIVHTRDAFQYTDILIDGRLHNVLGLGSLVVNPAMRSARGDPRLASVTFRQGQHRQDLSGTIFSAKDGSGQFHQPALGTALSLVLPAALNVHQMPREIRLIYGPEDDKTGESGGFAHPTTEVRTLSALASLQARGLKSGETRTLLSYVDPLSTYFVRYDKNDDPILGYHIEFPPLGISSMGTVTIETGASMTDRSRRPTASGFRRVVAQAIRQERVQEVRWLTQGQEFALLSQRLGSQLDTWPNPARRLITDPGVPLSMPDDPDLSQGGSAKSPTGFRPLTQPNLATGMVDWARPPGKRAIPLSHLQPDFVLPMGGVDPRAQSDLITDALETPKLSDQDIAPDGVHFAKEVLFPAIKMLGPEQPRGARTPNPVVNPAGPNAAPAAPATAPEVSARQISFWLKPDEDWKSGAPVVLFEARMPKGNAGRKVDGSDGDAELQNHLSLAFDRDKKLLVLSLASPVIEYLEDSQTQVPVDDVQTTGIDERSLGSQGTGQMAPLASRVGRPENLAKVSQLLKPNRIATLYKVPDREGKPYFRKDQWYHVQVALGGTRPGSHAIILDGIVGRDAQRHPSHTLSDHGDHVTLPGLPLSAPLTAVAVESDHTPIIPASNSITVTPIANLELTAEDLFPARGILRVDDEYISYERVQGNTFTGCVRGYRQNTDTSAHRDNPYTPVIPPRWPKVQGHRAEALVTPGGFRFQVSSARMYRGGAKLVETLPSGDPASPSTSGGPPGNPHPWTIWAQIDPDASPCEPDPSLPVNPDMRILDLTLAANRRLPLRAAGPTSGVADQFPQRGILLIQGGGGAPQYLYFERAGSTLTNLELVRPWQLHPPLEREDPRYPLFTRFRFHRLSPPRVFLLSIESTGCDAFEAGRYRELSSGDCEWIETYVGYDDAGVPIGLPARTAHHRRWLVQVTDGSTDRVEWLAYHQIARRDAGSPAYFVNWSGWGPNSRGRQRTDWAGKPGSLLSQTTAFPAGAALIPVQQWFGAPAHLLATGDVLTVIPRATPSTADQPGQPGRAFQTIIRYAARDGYDTEGTQIGEKSIDCKNEYFTFHVPTGKEHPWIDQPDLYDWLCGPCWTGRDLTGTNQWNLSSLFGVCQNSWFDHLPRFDLWKEGFTGSGSTGARVAFGGPDTGRGSTFTPVGMWIDGVCASPLPDSGMGRTAQMVLPTSLTDITISTALAISLSQHRLLSIDGEVFALTKGNTRDTRAPIGQGLLDLETTPVVHQIAEKPPGEPDDRKPLPTYLVLPIGPVTQFSTPPPKPDADKAVSGQYYIFTENELRAPKALICDKNGTPGVHELIELVGPIRIIDPRPGVAPIHAYFHSPWVHGLYNTPQAGIGPNQVVIGWWPRFAPSLPRQATPQHLRSRTYPWIGFPLRLFDCSFDSKLFGKAAIAQIEVPEAIDPLFALEARAMATGVDWTVPPVVGLNQGVNDRSLTAAFEHGQFNDKTVDGAELRVFWRYEANISGQLTDIAAAANRVPPLVGPTRLRCLAPAKVLATETNR